MQSYRIDSKQQKTNLDTLHIVGERERMYYENVEWEELKQFLARWGGSNGRQEKCSTLDTQMSKDFLQNAFAVTSIPCVFLF